MSEEDMVKTVVGGMIAIKLIDTAGKAMSHSNRRSYHPVPKSRPQQHTIKHHTLAKHKSSQSVWHI